MRSGLKIYACSGVGDIRKTTPEKLSYELEDTCTVSNTRSMNIILSILNDLKTKAKYSGAVVSPDTLNKMDLYAVAFYFARLYRGNKAMLVEAGERIQQMLDAGKFVSESTDLQEHSEIVDGYIEDITGLIQSGTTIEAKAGSFADWWQEYVVEMDEVGLTKEQQQITLDAIKTASSVAGTDKYGIDSDSDLSKYLNDGGEYFLYYMLFTEDEVKKLNYRIRKKWKKQKETYDYCVDCFVGIYGTEETMIRIIRCGIRETFSASLGEVKSGIIQGKNIGAITLTASMIVEIIIAVIGAVVAIIAAICQYAAKVQAAKYTQPDNVEDGIADASDYWDDDLTTTASSKWLAIGLGAVALGTYLKQNKKI